MAVKPLDQRVREAMGMQAWQILTLQQQVEELTAKLAAATAPAPDVAASPIRAPRPPKAKEST